MSSGLVYLVGCFGVNVFFNVPMNEALAGMDTAADTTCDYWTTTYFAALDILEHGSHHIGCGLSASLLLLGHFWSTQASTV
ncbi:MAG: hypothetical protein AAGA73_15435 [Pseudomonadota bacterium]